VRVNVLALNAACMHVDVSFSYLRSAATASFDIKKFHRNCTVIVIIVRCIHNYLKICVSRELGLFHATSLPPSRATITSGKNP
jgi:hypothetical protein